MLGRLFLLFTGVTLLELWLLVRLGRWMGVGWTIVLVFATGLNWITSLVITAIVGGVLGVVLGRGTAYWLTVAVLGVFTILAGFAIVGLFGS